MHSPLQRVSISFTKATSKTRKRGTSLPALHLLTCGSDFLIEVEKVDFPSDEDDVEVERPTKRIKVENKEADIESIESQPSVNDSFDNDSILKKFKVSIPLLSRPPLIRSWAELFRRELLKRDFIAALNLFLDLSEGRKLLVPFP